MADAEVGANKNSALILEFMSRNSIGNVNCEVFPPIVTHRWLVVALNGKDDCANVVCYIKDDWKQMSNGPFISTRNR